MVVATLIVSISIQFQIFIIPKHKIRIKGILIEKKTLSNGLIRPLIIIIKSSRGLCHSSPCVIQGMFCLMLNVILVFECYEILHNDSLL